MSHATFPRMLPSEVGLRVHAIKQRPISEFWLMRLGSGTFDPNQPSIDRTWTEVRELVSRCLIVRDVYAVISLLNANKIEKQTREELIVFKAQIPVVGGWKTRIEVENNPLKMTEWKRIVKEQTLPFEGLQIQLF